MKILKNKFAKIILTMLGVILITLISSCNNDDEAPAPPIPLPTANSNFIRATIDGIAYEATGAQVTALADASAFNFRSDATGTGMHFSLMGAPTVQSYTLNSSNGTTVGQLRYKSPDLYLTAKCSGSGTLTITAKNGNTIEGTFSFIGYKFVGACSEPTKAITNGTFKVTL